MTTVYEQYEFRGWLITIENYRGSEELIGFATPTKYAHLLNADNYYFIDEIADINGIQKKIDEDGDEYYDDLDYIIAEPDDVVVYFLAGIDTTKSSSVLEYIVKGILEHITSQNSYVGNSVVSRYDNVKILVLKQIQKKSRIPKVEKTKRGSLHQAWAALVKYRDKKCTECSSIYDLHAHHINQYKSHPDLRYDVENGITLCGVCHRKWHKKNGR